MECIKCPIVAEEKEDKKRERWTDRERETKREKQTDRERKTKMQCKERELYRE